MKIENVRDYVLWICLISYSTQSMHLCTFYDLFPVFNKASASRKLLLLHLHKERDDLQQRLQATELARCAAKPSAL